MERILQIKQKIDETLQKKILQEQLKPIQEEMKEQLNIMNGYRDKLIDITNDLKK